MVSTEPSPRMARKPVRDSQLLSDYFEIPDIPTMSSWKSQLEVQAKLNLHDIVAAEAVFNAD
jgi:hypothetical protein